MQEAPEKRQKHRGPTSLEACEIISKVAVFRREGPKILHEILSAETEEMLKSLRDISIELDDRFKAKIPDLADIPPSIDCAQKHTADELQRRSTLLRVLHEKEKCPIARIIDQI